MAKLVKRPDINSIRIQSLLPELFKALKVTNSHFWQNLLFKKQTPTIKYPEEKVKYAPRFRGRHRLMLRENGRVRCVACMCCATACPSNCIHIEAGESDDKSIEKYPVKFEIDLLKCIFCGLCEEACPQDAIRLDTGTHASPSYTRDENYVYKEDLLKDAGISTAK